MHAVPDNTPTLPAGWAALLKLDGHRTLAGRWAEGRIAVRGCHGSTLARASPEIEEAFRRPPAATLYDPWHGTMPEEKTSPTCRRR